MSTQKSPSLLDRFELTHPSLPHPSRFMRLLYPIILILLITVVRVRYQFAMSYTVTSQFVGYDLPGLTAMIAQ